MASPNQLQRNKNKKPKASPNQLQRNKNKKPKASPNQLQRNKDKKPKASPNQLQKNKNNKPKDRVFRPGKEFFEKLKEKERPFEKQKKFKSYKGTKGMSPGEKKALIGPTKPYTGIEGMSPGEKKALIGSRPGTNFGSIKKSSNNKNKITELSTRILAGGILLGPAAFATTLLYNEYLKQKAKLRKDRKLRKKT